MMNNIFFITMPSEILCNLCNLFYSSKWVAFVKSGNNCGLFEVTQVT